MRSTHAAIVPFLMLFAAGAGAALGAEPDCIPAFTKLEEFDAGVNMGTSALADFNRDGKTDLTTGVSLLMGDGAGGFGTPLELAGRPELPFDVFPRDFDNDGILDLAVGGFASEESIYIYYGRESGNGAPFEDPVIRRSLSSPWHLGVEDFDEDGDLDVVAVSMIEPAIGIHLNTGDRSFGFTRLEPLPVDGGHFIATGDLDNDGHQDIAMGMGEQVALLFGNGDGTFLPPLESRLRTPSGGQAAHRMRAADLDGDGRADLAAIGQTRVLIYYGSNMTRENGLPAEADLVLDLECHGRFLEILDMNGDGALDLVTQGVCDRTLLQIFWGMPGPEQGTRFEAGTSFSSAISAGGSVLAVGDITGEGAPDIVLTSEDTHRGQVFLNDRSCMNLNADPGDVNADGDINVADPIGILSYLFSEERLNCFEAAKVNEDDQLDLADAIYLLTFLFAGGPPPVPTERVDCFAR